MVEQAADRFDPDSDALFNVLLPEITDDMLREIAAADYGNDIEQDLAPLKLFRDQRVVPVLDWHPVEVLELIRWSEPEYPDWKPGTTGTRGHLLRAFACAVLLRAYDRPENRMRWHSFNETAIQLVRSLRELGGSMLLAGPRFLAWCVVALDELDEDGIEGSFLGLALLSLVASSASYPDEDVIALCKWIDERVSGLLRDKQCWATRRHNWLLSTNHHDQKNAEWIEIGRELYRWGEAQAPSERATWVALVGRSLAED